LEENKMHLSDGEIRAYQDGAASEHEVERAQAHLAICARCQEKAERLAERASQIEAHLAVLVPTQREMPISASQARAKIEIKRSREEELTMFQKVFSRQYRTAWVVGGIIAILAIALLFPPVRAAANSFLGLFRVEKFSVVQVNPGNLPEQLGSNSSFENLLSDSVTIEKQGEAREVADASEASALAGIPVRLPSNVSGDLKLEVQPGEKATFKIDLPRVRAVLDEIGRSDIVLPDEIDGETVTVELPTAVAASYGICDHTSEAAREAGADPDNPASIRAFCTTLVQMVSPTVEAPPGLDIAGLGQAFLQLMGMSAKEAAQFSQQVDWTTTLVIPIPRNGAKYEDVVVDGVPGTLIHQSLEAHAPEFLLIWLKDGVIYALTGPGKGERALEIANSLK
jgi:hypothetical protein